jgi:hypothetical protein
LFVSDDLLSILIYIVCLFVNMRPARDADVFANYTGTILQFYKFQ